MPPSPRYAPPKQWLFNADDRTSYQETFWRCPIRLVTGGQWAALWREDGTRRGGGVVPSVLPVLALHTWPGKRYLGEGADVPPASPDAARWTTWHYLSHRRVARLAGVNTETVGKVFERLAEAGLLERRTLPPAKYVGGPARQEYRLSAALYPAAGASGRGLERYAEFSATLVYGGVWRLLPTAAARHLYVTIACLDPVLGEEAYLAAVESNSDFRVDPVDANTLRETRERHPRSVAELTEASGMKRSTVEEALQILTAPLYHRAGPGTTGAPDLALVATGPAGGAAGRNGVRWYAPERRATAWFWAPDTLNNAEATVRLQATYWPTLAKRRTAQQKRAKAKATAQTRARTFRERVEAGARQERGGS